MEPLNTGYDLQKHPTADEPDPIAWFLGTGEDIGLPPGWLDDWNKRYAENLAKAKGEKRHYGPGPHDNGTPQTVHGDREGSSQELEREAEAGGFSYRRIAGAPADGFMVSPYKQAERKYSLMTFNHEDVARYRERQRELLARPDHYLGGWRDGDVIYLDVSIRAADRSAAAVLARQHQQLAVFDLATGNVIPTEDLAA